MKFICPREDLSKALQTVLRSVGARAGIPALGGVLMQLGDSGLTLTTTDLELTTRVAIAVSGEAGQVLLPARLLSEIVRNLPSEDVELVQEGATMRVAGGRARFGLRFLPAEDFPQVQPDQQGPALSIDAGVFSRALGQVVIAASRDETRPVLTGVLFEGDGNELRLAATDSYRLSLRRLSVEQAGDGKMLVPARVAQEVARLATEGDVRIVSGGTQVSFEVGNVVLQSRLIEGEFPAYRQLLPDRLPNHLSVERTAFVESLRRVAVLAQDATPVFLELAGGEIRLTCQSQGLGDAVEEIDGEYAGEDMRVAFNPTYLSNGIDAVEDARVRIELADPQRPVLVRGGEDAAFVYLLMPIRVS